MEDERAHTFHRREPAVAVEKALIIILLGGTDKFTTIDNQISAPAPYQLQSYTI